MDNSQMDTSDDIFKPPALPTPTAQHVAFKMPHSRKLSDSTSAATDIETETDKKKIEPISTLESAGTEKVEEKTAKKSVGPKPSPSPLESTYKTPVWSGPCTGGNYDLDILKDGRIVGNIALATLGDGQEHNKPYYIFGRQADIVVEHPSISRHHAVIQYRSLGNPHELGWYLYDMGSTHGTFLNKEKISPFMFVPIRVGHMFKLGFSTRMYILNGPDEDREPESALSVTEIKEQGHRQKLLMSKRREPAPATLKDDEEEKKDESENPQAKSTDQEPDTGISWGMSEDYGEDDEEEGEGEEKKQVEQEDVGETVMETIEEIQKREQLYLDDPKKALKNFFERQGCGDEMNFEFTERGAGTRHQWTCRIELPIETETGRPVIAEASVSGGKKEAAVACALEACRLLDVAGLLRKSAQDSKKRKSKEWADNDYYDSDEDTFLDRTGEVERKRIKRMRQAAEIDGIGGGSKSETYDTLSGKLNSVKSEIDRVQQQIDLIKAEAAQEDDRSPTDPIPNKDSLDAYMATMSRRDTHEAKIQQSRLRLKLIELKKSADRLEKLVKLAKPATLPPIVVKKTLESNSKKQPVLIGTMKGHRLRKLVPQPEMPKEEKSVEQTGLKEEEVVEIEEEEESKKDFKKEETLEKIRDMEKRSSQPKIPPSKISSPLKPSASTSVDISKIYTVSPPIEPEPIDQSIDQSEKKIDSEESQQSSKKQRQKKNKNKPASKEDFGDYDPSDINYATWLPPDNQSGDGKTSLNDKFGY